VRVSPSSRRPTAIVTALLAAALLASLPIEAPAAATPTIEVLASTPEAVSLRFDADADSRAPLSVLVRVPDAGVIEAHIAPQTASGSITISEPAIMRDLRVVRVTFTPTEQAARAGADPRTVDVTLRATGEPGLNEKRRHHSHVSPAFRGLYESQVVNYDASMERALTSADRTGASAAAPRSGRDPLPFGGRYLIIVWDAVEYLVEPLAEWKHRKGIQTRVVKLSDVGSTPEEIKDYIQTAYDTWAVPPEYVLLVGDTEQLPVYYGLTHTDNYYATVDGTDYLADIMVGRLTADGPGHCSTQVAKILGYERTPLENDPNWPASATLMIADDFDDGDWVYYMNTWLIYDLMDSAGFAPVDTLFRRNPVLIGDVYDSVNAGKGFLNFRGQALVNWNMPFSIDPYATTSGWRLPVVISATCGTGVYDVDGYVCEDWVRAGSATDPAGGVAFFGANTIIAGSLELALRRGYVDEGFMADAFGPDGLTLGQACLAGKLKLFLNDPNPQEYQAWNLLGDPELNLWTAPPSYLTVIHDEGVPSAPSDFGVTVLMSGEPVEDALVACVQGTDVYVWGYTDALGAVSLPISPAAEGTLAVTVTARNAYPYEGEAFVLPSGPFLAYAGIAIDDASGGNGDGYLSPGESALVRIALTNIGDDAATALTATFRTHDSYTTLLDSLCYYGDVLPQSTEWGADTFELSIHPNCPIERFIPFTLSLAYGGTSAVLHPAPIEIAAGHLAFSANETIDGPPGGDGDGAPGAGETVALVLTLMNDGECGLTAIEGTLTTEDEYLAVTSGHAAFTDASAGTTCDNGRLPFILSVSPIAPDGHVASLSLALTAAGHSYQYGGSVDLDLLLSGQSSVGPTGPDDYGYYAYDEADTAYGPAPTFDWFDIAPPGPGTIITEITDADAATALLGFFFDFPYYGTTYTEMSACSNGFVAMGLTDYRFGDNSSIPDAHGPPNMIAPFWDDLDPSAGGDIYRFLDAANHRYIVQFDEVRHWDSPDAETFQVILLNPAYYPTPTGDGMILIQYEDVSDPSLCTVGIENLIQTKGIEWVYNGNYGPGTAPITDGTAILFTTIAPEDPDVPWLVAGDVVIDDSAGGNGDGLLQPGESVSLTLELMNEGGQGAASVSVVLSSDEGVLSVVDSTAAFPDVPSGGSSQNTGDPFTLTVSEAVPDTVATLWAHVTANGGNYTSVARLDLHIDLTATGVEHGETPAVFRFRPAYPNPFADDTRMTLALPSPERVTVRIYSANGRLVRTLVDAPLEAGRHVIPWDGADRSGSRVASGVYFVRVEAGAESASAKVVYLR